MIINQLSEDAPPFFPIPVDVEEGKTYHWCRCGKSRNQPFCEEPPCCEGVLFTASLTETVYFCGCKQTATPPFCDGSHGKLLLEYLKKKGKTQ